MACIVALSRMSRLKWDAKIDLLVTKIFALQMRAPLYKNENRMHSRP
jgi:hypothetical protein